MSVLYAFAMTHIAVFLLYISDQQRWPFSWVPPVAFKYVALLVYAGWAVLLLAASQFAHVYGWELGVPIWLGGIMLSAVAIILLIRLRSFAVALSVVAAALAVLMITIVGVLL